LKNEDEISKELRFSVRHVKKLIKALPNESPEYQACQTLLKDLLLMSETLTSKEGLSGGKL
jgi:hypothetical protein